MPKPRPGVVVHLPTADDEKLRYRECTSKSIFFSRGEAKAALRSYKQRYPEARRAKKHPLHVYRCPWTVARDDRPHYHFGHRQVPKTGDE